MRMSDERSLIEALQRGDDAAFRRVVMQYHASLVRAARSFVPSTAIAEEVAQETWIAVVRGIGRFEGRSSFKTWLFRILMNQAQTRGIRESRSTPVSTQLDDETPNGIAGRFHDAGERDAGHWRSAPSDWGRLPESLVESDETATTILEAIAALPARQREVITLRDVEGLTAAEVADVLDLSEGNQRVLLHRGRSKVRAMLERHFEGVAAS